MSTRKLRRKYRPSSMPVQGKGRIVRRALSHRREIDHGKTWYCICTKIGFAKRAEIGLRQRGYDVFRPVDDRWRIHKHRCSDVSLGWFGRYLFVGTRGPGRFDLIRETDGVEGILATAGRPATVSPGLLQRCADEIAGFKKTAPEASFEAGQRVSVQRGSFAELCGVIEETGNGLARVIVEMFGKSHAVELELVDLKAA